MASSSRSFVPLVEYHGGGAAATLEPLNEYWGIYYQIMMANCDAGVQVCYRSPRLFDTDEAKACVQIVISWYKRYRDALNSDVIHLRRLDGRDGDGDFRRRTYRQLSGICRGMRDARLGCGLLCGVEECFVYLVQSSAPNWGGGCLEVWELVLSVKKTVKSDFYCIDFILI